MAEEVRTTCPYCGVGCGILAGLSPEGSVKIEGDPDHPANFGRLCSKGSALGETVDLGGRLLFPEVGGQRVDWDSALDLVAAAFSDTIRTHGPDSVAFYVSGQILTEDYYVANKLMKGFIGSGNIDTNSRLCMASSVAGHRRAFGTDTVPGTYDDLEQADAIVLVGSNLAWCHPVLHQRIAAAKAKNPNLRVVLVDPRRTKTAELADMHLAITPDSDCALFVGLLNWLEAHEKVRDDWVSAHTSGFGDALSLAQCWPVRRVAEATELRERELTDFYRLWAGTERVVTCYSQGVNQSGSGTDKVNAIINCHLATARIGRAGMGPFSLTGQPNAMGGREVGGLANMLAAHMDIDNADHRDRVARFWKAPNVTARPGLKAVDMFRAVADGRIRALWIMATNPVVSMPEADAVAAALEACPFVVASDIVAETDTMRFASVKLPSLGWGEKDGTVTNSERRISRQRAFLPAPGEAKADWWQMAEVGKRMGWRTAFDWRDNAAIFREFAALTAFENDGGRDLDLSALQDISNQQFDALVPFQWPQANALSPRTTTRFFANGQFFTPDRKGRFVAVRPPAAASAPGFRLNTGRVRDHWHTMTRTAKSPRLNAHMAEPYCEIHPADARRLRIADASLVRISAAGAGAIVRALVTPDQMPGNVFVPMHWNAQYASAGRIDALVAAVTDPVSGQPASKQSFVSVERIDMALHGFAVTRDRPDTAGLDYWAIAPAAGGWRIEFALREEPTMPSRVLARFVSVKDTMAMLDQMRGVWRAAGFEDGRLQAAAFLSRGLVEVSRSWAAALLKQPALDGKDRWRALAGRPPADMPDKGTIVCACMSVGANEIAGAVRCGNQTVEAVGKATDAGTNCGSCKAEIAELIHAHCSVAAQ